jgi:DNA invertase Pin-like site-specific DNA recombinase
MTQLIGYARVSSRDQNLDSQLDMLKAAGCKKIFQEKASGVSDTRVKWDELIEYVRPGDTVVVVELSRMTRSLMHLLQLAKDFEEKGLNLRSLRENIDTSTATGRAFLSIMGAINQMERELKSERAAAGRASAKARGRTGGRPRTDETKLKQAFILYDGSDYTSEEVCKLTGIGRRTFFRYIAETRQAEYEAHLEARAQVPMAVGDAQF